MRGPAAVVIVMLLDMQWDPVVPGRWKDREGVLWVSDGGGDLDELWAVVHSDVGTIIWARAAKHYYGQGFGGGAGHDDG